MHDGRDVAARRTDVGDEVRGHDADGQQQLSDDMESSQPLTCARLVVLALRGLTCGTPPARARRAIEVRVEKEQRRDRGRCSFSSGAAAAALARGHAVFRKTDLVHFVTFNEISAT